MDAPAKDSKLWRGGIVPHEINPDPGNIAPIQKPSDPEPHIDKLRARILAFAFNGLIPVPLT